MHASAWALVSAQYEERELTGMAGLGLARKGRMRSPRLPLRLTGLVVRGLGAPSLVVRGCGSSSEVRAVSSLVGRGEVARVMGEWERR